MIISLNHFKENCLSLLSINNFCKQVKRTKNSCVRMFHFHSLIQTSHFARKSMKSSLCFVFNLWKGGYTENISVVPECKLLEAYASNFMLLYNIKTSRVRTQNIWTFWLSLINVNENSTQLIHVTKYAWNACKLEVSEVSFQMIYYYKRLIVIVL